VIRQSLRSQSASTARNAVIASLLGACLALPMAVRADEPAADPHAAHRHAMEEALKRSEGSYELPDIKLVRQDGKRMALSEIFDDSRPVVLNFIYTTCTTICPVTSAVFSQFQSRVAATNGPIHLVSISIDPEQDTTTRLVAYANTFHAGPNWDHYTGTIEASIATQRAFSVYRGDKMNHAPVTLLRAAHSKTWVRLDGLATPDDLYGEYQKFVAAR